MAVSWNSSINQKVRRGSSWSEPERFIEDETRSGKPRRKLAYSSALKKFSVSMRFDYTEYQLFKAWFKNDLKDGFLSFYFPKIDEINGELTEYRFTADGMPSYSNTSGDLIDVSMEWEEL